VPAAGVFPLSPSLDHAGTLTATAADGIALLQAIAGPLPTAPVAGGAAAGVPVIGVLSAQLAASLLGISKPVAVRPEQMRIVGDGSAIEPGWVTMSGTVADSQYHGATLRVQVRTADGELLTIARPEGGNGNGDSGARTGSTVKIAWPRASVVELEAERA